MGKKSKQKDETENLQEEKTPEVEPQSGGGEQPAPPPKPQSGDTVKNISTGIHYVCGHRVAPGGEHVLSKRDKADEQSMKRIERAVRMGYLERS